MLFQSDIRRALAHLGRAPFFRYFAKPESAEESIEEMVVAASMLSSQRVGAIIAVERQIGLRNYIEGGIPLDAIMTYDLLMSIFQLDAPLHDGAVIVQNDRIAAAACFLPLTVNPKLSKELGSRHRAAIGLTEENDSLAIVVSEETGGSLSSPTGRSSAVSSPTRCGSGCARSFRRWASAGRRCPRASNTRHDAGRCLVKLVSMWPFRHAGLKVISLALAVALWMAVSGEEVVERGLRIPLELQQFPPGLELAGEPFTFVDVRVRGCSGTLGRVTPSDVVATLDLRAARPGRRLFQLTPENMRVPFGVEVVQVTPSSIAIVFEKSATRQIPIAPEVEGNPAPGFIVGNVTADPKTIEVTGPESAVTRATEAVTEAVSVAGARSRVAEVVRVGLLDPLLRLKTPRSVNVRVEMLPGPRERTVGQPVHLRNLAAGAGGPGASGGRGRRAARQPRRAQPDRSGESRPMSISAVWARRLFVAGGG